MKRSLIFVIAVGLAVGALGIAKAEERVLPNVLSYQSMLFDDGGNPIADGSVGVSFRIADAAGNVLYEERQTLEAVRGQVSALVGNGLTADGAPAGGISESVLSPSGARYLEVQVDGMPPASSMEIASVPYAVYASEALSAAKGSIGADAIADGSLAYEDLSQDLVAKLAGALTGGRGGTGEILVRGDIESMYRDPASASSIGVNPGFVYSSANDLQGVLQDLDRSVKRREERIVAETDARKTAMTNEATVRETQDTALQTNINSEATARQTADGNLQTNINSEASARQTADGNLQTNINSEASARKTADGNLQTNINSEASARKTEDGNLKTNIDNEASARQTADGNLQTNIDNEASARAAADEAEAAARAAADATHQAMPHVGAWCTISRWEGLIVEARCVNATLSVFGETGKCKVSFQQPMEDDRYALVTMPAVTITNKDRNEFVVSFPCPTFDFIAIGR